MILSQRTFSIPYLVFYILRGAVLGCVIGACINISHMPLFLREEVLIEQVAGAKENKENERSIPEIPQDYQTNLSKPVDVISEGNGVLLQPQKIIDYLSEDDKNEYYVIFLIPVSPLDVRRRFLWRMSWTRVFEIENKRVGYFYVAGRGRNDASDKLLANENEKYGDILQVSLDTSPRNFSSLLILAGCQWSLSEIGVRSTFYVVSANDIFVDVENVYEYLMKMQTENSYDNFHCGYHMTGAHLKPRNPLSPYYVSDDVYMTKAYPSYCNSDMVIMSHQLLHKFYNIARYTKLGTLPNEGAYLWGILRVKLRANGIENLVYAGDFVENSAFPQLGYQLEVGNSLLSRKECARHWMNVQEKLLILGEAEERNKEATPRRIAKLTNTSTIPERYKTICTMIGKT